MSRPFINLNDGTDATFVVGNGSNQVEIDVMKVLLAMSSEYFNKLFSNKHFKHTRKDINRCINHSSSEAAASTSDDQHSALGTSSSSCSDTFGSKQVVSPVSDNARSMDVYYEPDVSPETFKLILNYCYGGFGEGKPVIDDKNIVDLLDASEKFLLSDLRQECCTFLAQNTTVDNIIDIMIRLEQSKLVNYFNYGDIQQQLKQGFVRLSNKDTANASTLCLQCQDLLACGMFIPLNAFLTYFVTHDKFVKHAKQEAIYQTCLKYCHSIINYNLEFALPQQTEVCRTNVEFKTAASDHDKVSEMKDNQETEQNRDHDKNPTNIDHDKDTTNDQTKKTKPCDNPYEVKQSCISGVNHTVDEKTGSTQTNLNISEAEAGITMGAKGCIAGVSSAGSDIKKLTWQQIMRDYFLPHIKIDQMDSYYLEAEIYHDTTLFSAAERDTIIKPIIDERKQIEQLQKDGKICVLPFTMTQSSRWEGVECTSNAVSSNDDFCQGTSTKTKENSWIEFSMDDAGNTGVVISELHIACLKYEDEYAQQRGDGQQYLNGVIVEYFSLKAQQYVGLFTLDGIRQEEVVYKFDMRKILTNKVRLTNNNNIIAASFIQFQGFSHAQQKSGDD